MEEKMSEPSNDKEPTKIPFKFENSVDYSTLTDTIEKHLPESGLVGQIDIISPPNYSWSKPGQFPEPWKQMHYLRDIQMAQENNRVDSAVLYTFTAPEDIADLVTAELENAA
jgi:hypothetical protein